MKLERKNLEVGKWNWCNFNNNQTCDLSIRILYQQN